MGKAEQNFLRVDLLGGEQKNADENLNEQSTDHLSDAAKPQPKQKKHRTTD
ncbi:9751_t:CDS:2 [Funneliformis caledonium]|uniref:9751_t:CDS:1 n=1 Tax=Funneliformis caledonium TaxID=1117310 RepID=A0A9N8Z772_9GLOM|nr:9751_t:CDS:2 [Funneliformis caledonium]